MKIEFDDNYFMSKAIDEAKIALSKGEVPIGAVIVADNKVDNFLTKEGFSNPDIVYRLKNKLKKYLLL